MPGPVGIGIQDFGKLITNGCFYIDKTYFIKDWWESHDDVTLITRPRRFGKTLTMSMLERFFSVQDAGSRMFEHLWIWEEEKYRGLQGTYPVISMSFARVKGKDYKAVRDAICQIIADIYMKHRFLMEGELLAEPEKRYFEQVCDTMDDAVAVAAIQRLSEYLFRYYGKKVILLLDEYDTPLQEAYVNGYWEEISDFIRKMFHASFKDNQNLERAVMTGITRVSRESVFSDLNHLKVVTVTSEKYATVFGFTEAEVFEALEAYGLHDRKREVKEWYDGFRFGNCDNIYNPWSVLNFLDERRIDGYWVNTSSNQMIERLIGGSSSLVKQIVEDLISGGDFCTSVNENLVYDQLDQEENAVWSLLLASGYLKVKQCFADPEWGDVKYVLALTNKEVAGMFRNMVKNWFSGCSSSYHDFIKALLRNDLEAMNGYMNRVALATFSIFDAGTKSSKTAEPERFYHGFFLGLSVGLSDRYSITSNRESGFGRYDVMFEPKDGRSDAMIIEFKVHGRGTRMEETVHAAVSQILKKKYAAALEEKGIPKNRIRIYGFAFQGKQVLIGGGYLMDYETTDECGSMADR